MFEKKVTRKEFLLSIVSVGAIIAASKVPHAVKKIAETQSQPYAQKSKNLPQAYGKLTYGSSQNA